MERNLTLTRTSLAIGAVAVFVVGVVVGALGWSSRNSNDLPDPGDYYPAQALPPDDFVPLRSAPYTSGYYRDFVPYGEHIQIECAVEGEPVARNDLNSTLWYRLSGGLYTTSIYVAPDNKWDIRMCPDGAPEPPTGLQETAVGDAFFTPDSGDLEIHEQPSNDSKVIRTVPFRARVTLLCHVFGTVGDGVNGATELWYQIEGGGWVFDGYILTGTIDPVVKECPAS